MYPCTFRDFHEPECVRERGRESGIIGRACKIHIPTHAWSMILPLNEAKAASYWWPSWTAFVLDIDTSVYVLLNQKKKHISSLPDTWISHNFPIIKLLLCVFLSSQMSFKSKSVDWSKSNIHQISANNDCFAEATIKSYFFFHWTGAPLNVSSVKNKKNIF